MAAEGTNEVMQVMEILLTAEIFNRNRDLDGNDLPPRCREAFGMGPDGQVKRPVIVSDGTVAQATGIGDASEKVKGNPFVELDSFGHRMRISALDAAAGWFLKKGGKAQITRNPALASFFEGFDSAGVSYRDVKAGNPRVEDTRACLDARIAALTVGDEALKAALELLIVSAPDEVEPRLSDLICTGQQAAIASKVRTALLHRDLLRSHRIYELGKLLFVGPPGTGKTTLALALSRELHMPMLEVRLSMVTSQYLGETSKNIDRIFEFAKKIAPAILFIDEFDFVAKSRITDDHGAMKRAVNMLLKNIDRVSLVRDGVLLLAATNHPQLLDEAAWRRFDEVVEFFLPDAGMRKAILAKVTNSLPWDGDLGELAGMTEGFSGADLRVLVKEALLSSLVRESSRIEREDIERGFTLVTNRNMLRGTPSG
ncbi:MAG TPA: ATP-binding protein [Methanomicrobiales archaeon]|nr:ATP-binding protein [Methanomicrobiales archaeon]